MIGVTRAREEPRMIRLPGRHGVPEVALVAGVLFAAIPLSAAAGQDTGRDELVVQAAAQMPTSAVDQVSPMALQTLRSIEAEYAAAQASLATNKVAAILVGEQQATAAQLVPSAVVPPGTSVPLTAPPTGTSTPAKAREIQGLVRRYFPRSQLGNAMAVARCESGLTDAVGAKNADGTTDWGAFQLNDGGTLQGALTAIGVPFGSVAEAQQRALDTAVNVRAAANVYASRGWAPWVCAYKIGVVASLYSNEPGPMDGKFDAWGNPTVTPPPIKPVPDPPPPPDDPPPSPTPEPSRRPTPSPTPSPTPTTDPSPTERPSPTQSSRPDPTAVPPG